MDVPWGPHSTLRYPLLEPASSHARVSASDDLSRGGMPAPVSVTVNSRCPGSAVSGTRRIERCTAPLVVARTALSSSRPRVSRRALACPSYMCPSSGGMYHARPIPEFSAAAVTASCASRTRCCRLKAVRCSPTLVWSSSLPGLSIILARSPAAPSMFSAYWRTAGGREQWPRAAPSRMRRSSGGRSRFSHMPGSTAEADFFWFLAGAATGSRSELSEMSTGSAEKSAAVLPVTAEGGKRRRLGSSSGVSRLMGPSFGPAPRLELISAASSAAELRLPSAADSRFAPFLASSAWAASRGRPVPAMSRALRAVPHRGAEASRFAA